MAKVCFVCQKVKVAGRHVARRGMARAKGGAGRKITERSRRVFMPNLQKVRIINERGRVSQVYVCTKCLKSGKIRKA